MNIKLIRKILTALTFISAVVTCVSITWKIVQHNNLKVEAKTNSYSYKQISIDKKDVYKLVNFKNNSYVFNMRNTEYYLVHKTLTKYPEIANKEFSFKVDDQQYPKNVEMSISGQKATKWFYSIIY